MVNSGKKSKKSLSKLKKIDTGLTFCKGSSMYPSLKGGDKLIFSNDNSYKIGDIIGYYFNNRGIVHRIVSVNKNSIRTKGDNNTDVDDYTILKNDIIGKIIKYERNGKVFRVRNGFSGYLISKKCFYIKRLKRIILLVGKFIYYTKLSKPLIIILNTIGNRIYDNKLSIFKSINNSYKIFYNKSYCGKYNIQSQKWYIISILKPLFSNKLLRKYEKTILSKCK